MIKVQKLKARSPSFIYFYLRHFLAESEVLGKRKNRSSRGEWFYYTCERTLPICVSHAINSTLILDFEYAYIVNNLDSPHP